MAEADLSAVLDPTPDVPASDPAPSSAAPPAEPAGDYDFDDESAKAALAIPAATSETPVVAPEAGAGTPAAPAFSDAQLQRAASLGWGPDQLASFKDPEIGLLNAEKLALQTHYNAVAQQQIQAQQFAAARQPQAPPPQPPAPPPALDENAVRKAWLDAGYEANVADMQVGVAKDLHAARLETHQQALQNFEMQQWAHKAYAHQMGVAQQVQAQQVAYAQELITRDFADFKQALPESTRGLIDDAAQRAIFAAADYTLKGMMANGVPPNQLPDNKTLFRSAMYAALGEKIVSTLGAQAREKVREEVTQHQNRVIPRPSSASRPTAPGGIEAAGRAADDWYRKMGMGVQGSGFSGQDV